jgi:hypothetical protein
MTWTGKGRAACKARSREMACGGSEGAALVMNKKESIRMREEMEILDVEGAIVWKVEVCYGRSRVLL